MKLLRSHLLLGLAFIPVTLTCAKEMPRSHGLRRHAQEDILDAGIGAVHAICNDPLVSECASNDMHVKEQLAAVLGAKSHVTAVGSIELGELLCDNLDKVPDSTLLRFEIGSNQTVIAERVYYKVMEGDPLTDNKERKVWIGDVIDPAPPAGSTASTISITWTEPCDVGDFFLKMTTRKSDGSTAVVTSMPCTAGSSQEICLVKTNAVFKKRGGARRLKEKSGTPRRSLKDNRDAGATPSIRKLQTKTQIDVLVLYTPEGMEEAMVTSASEMETLLKYYFAEVNLGNDNSLIMLEYNVVHVTELPYEQEAGSQDALVSMIHNAEVSVIRNNVGADLVHLIGSFFDFCGLAVYFHDHDSGGYGLTSGDCLDDLTIGHELGHNMGCDHDRDTVADEDEDHSYAYGKRYCNGTDPYVTIMSYENDCNGSYVNYYSNPDVTYLDKPTGTETENCARRIQETMDTVSDYRQTGGGGCASTGDPCTNTSDCCDSTCLEGVCGPCIYGFSRGDGICDAAMNTFECGWDDGDCCECSSTARSSSFTSSTSSTSSDDNQGDSTSSTPSTSSTSSTSSTFSTSSASSTSSDGNVIFNCLDPNPQCLDNCAGTWPYINDNYCDAENNNADCRWDGGDCCQFSCEANLSEACNPYGFEYNCRQGVL